MPQSPKLPLLFLDQCLSGNKYQRFSIFFSFNSSLCRSRKEQYLCGRMPRSDEAVAGRMVINWLPEGLTLARVATRIEGSVLVLFVGLMGDRHPQSKQPLLLVPVLLGCLRAPTLTLSLALAIAFWLSPSACPWYNHPHEKTNFIYGADSRHHKFCIP